MLTCCLMYPPTNRCHDDIQSFALQCYSLHLSMLIMLCLISVCESQHVMQQRVCCKKRRVLSFSLSPLLWDCGWRPTLTAGSQADWRWGGGCRRQWRDPSGRWQCMTSPSQLLQHWRWRTEASSSSPPGAEKQTVKPVSASMHSD